MPEPRLDKKRGDAWNEHQKDIAKRTVVSDGKIVLTFYLDTKLDDIQRVLDCVNALEGVNNPSMVRNLLIALRTRNREQLKECLNAIEFIEGKRNGHATQNRQDNLG